MNTLAYQRRAAALFARYGEDVTLTRNGTGRALRGIFEPLSQATAETYFDANEAVELVRPGLVLHLDGSLAATDPPAEGDVVQRDGRLYTVRRVAIERLANTPLTITVLLD